MDVLSAVAVAEGFSARSLALPPLTEAQLFTFFTSSTTDYAQPPQPDPSAPQLVDSEMCEMQERLQLHCLLEGHRRPALAVPLPSPHKPSLSAVSSADDGLRQKRPAGRPRDVLLADDPLRNFHLRPYLTQQTSPSSRRMSYSCKVCHAVEWKGIKNSKSAIKKHFDRKHHHVYLIAQPKSHSTARRLDPQTVCPSPPKCG